MASVTVRDDAIWFKHIEGDPRLPSRLEQLKAGETIILTVDGVRGVWERMQDGKDGRPTLGIKPAGAMKAYWRKLRQERTGDRIAIQPIEKSREDLDALTGLLGEWSSAEDELAYNDL